MEKTKTSLYGPQESFNVPFEQLISFKCHKNNFCWIGILGIKGLLLLVHALGMSLKFYTYWKFPFQNLIVSRLVAIIVTHFNNRKNYSGKEDDAIDKSRCYNSPLSIRNTAEEFTRTKHSLCKIYFTHYIIKSKVLLKW